jgi:hypothetical protein
LDLPRSAEASFGNLVFLSFFLRRSSFCFLAYSFTFNYFSKAAAFFASASLTFSNFSFLALIEALALVLF